MTSKLYCNLHHAVLQFLVQLVAFNHLINIAIKHMALKYRITKRTNTIQNKKEQFIMQAIHTGIVDADTMSRAISNECTLHEADIKAVLVALGKKLDFYLSDGKVVDLEFIGKFKIGFQCKAVDEAETLSPTKHIKKFHINYQPSKKLKQALRVGYKVRKEKAS